jgi:adenosylmethionine-8-amino-7-oxononanoate aminotransferase
MTSGYSPIGAMIASERVIEPFLEGTTTFPHGYTFGGHPVSCAVALANLDLMEQEGLNRHVRDHEDAFAATLGQLRDLPIVGDVRGDGFFQSIELVKDRSTKQTLDAEEIERVLRGYVSTALFEAGLYARTDNRGEPVVQLAPVLTSGQAEFDEMEQILRSVLTEAWSRL